ncbi:MAG TPA: restriction endonuclease subunit S [Candidatus Acidoferrales bacterium]|nr:restriction endonuclease subunit S [Candidatus Acidoferrales bacterium]
MKAWPTKPLGEVCELVNGRAFKPNEWQDAGLPIIRIQNLNDPTKPFNYTTHALPEKFKVRHGDTLLSWSGTPGTSFGCFRWDGPEGWLNQHIFNVHLGEEILPAFFIHQVNSKLNELITKAHGGVGLQHVTKGALSSVAIAVPPLAEQERIVKLLDEVDELRKLRARADRRTADLIPALFHEMFGDPILNPHKWPKTTLGQTCQKLTDGTHFSPPPAEAGVPYITAKHLREYGLDFDRDPTYVSLDNHREIYARCDPKPGDVLYIKDGVTTGLAAVNRYDHEFSMLSSLALMRPDATKCDSEFLCAWLNDKAVKTSMLGQMAGAAIRRLTLVKLKKTAILLPPLPMQKEFARRMTEVRVLKVKQATSRRRLEDLFQSLLHRAFQGEL